jgi:hypothetical protein
VVDTGQAVVDIYCHPRGKFLWKDHPRDVLLALQELLRIGHDWGDEDWPNVFSLPKTVTLNMSSKSWSSTSLKLVHSQHKTNTSVWKFQNFWYCPKIPEFLDTSKAETHTHESTCNTHAHTRTHALDLLNIVYTIWFGRENNSGMFFGMSPSCDICSMKRADITRRGVPVKKQFLENSGILGRKCFVQKFRNFVPIL